MTIKVTFTLIIIVLVVLLVVIQTTWRISRYVTGKTAYEIIIEQLANSYDMEVVDNVFDKITNTLDDNPDYGWKGYIYILIGWNKMFREAIEEYCNNNGMKFSIKYKPLTNQAYLEIKKDKIVQEVNGGEEDSVWEDAKQA